MGIDRFPAMVLATSCDILIPNFKSATGCLGRWQGWASRSHGNEIPDVPQVAPSQASQCRGDVEKDPIVASDMDMAMASDGLMTFCLSEKGATAGGVTETAPMDDEKDRSRDNAKDCAEVAEAEAPDALKPSAVPRLEGWELNAFNDMV